MLLGRKTTTNKQTVQGMVMIMTTSVMGVMEMGNIPHRVGIEPKYFAFQTTVLTIIPLMLPDATTLPTSNCLCGSFLDRSVQILQWFFW